MTLLRAGDATTTQIALHAGATELNPLLPDAPVPNLITQAAWTTGEVWALHAYADHHPTAARWVTVGAIALEGCVVVQNARVASKGR